MRLFISAGEASGDALGAALLRALRAQVPDLDAFGMGGPRMIAEGFRAKRRAEEVAVVGFAEVVRHLPRLFRLADALVADAVASRPDAAILIDVPDFNLRVARRLRAASIPIAFYVGPSVWAWRASRVETFRRAIDRLMVLFPFELPVWQRAGVDVACVGHPLLDEIPRPSPDEDAEPRTIALLPGSRPGEIRRHLSTMLEASEILAARGVADRFVLPVAPTLDPAELRRMIPPSRIAERVELVRADGGDPGPRRRAIASASVAMVASGTATLETALIGRPQVIVYRVSWLSWLIGRALVRLEHLGLPNIIAGREVVPELLQSALTGPRLAEATARLVEDAAARRSMAAAYDEIRGRLGAPGGAERAAALVLDLAAPRALPG